MSSETLHRADLPFDTSFFKKEKANNKTYTTEEVFQMIYKTNHWKDEFSASGNGSNDIQTKTIKKALPKLLNEYSIKTMLDLPCGDFYWLSRLNLGIEKYIGGDIVKEIIEKNTSLYGDENKEFMIMNLISDDLPSADIIFCRDCLVHLSHEDIIKSIRNIKRTKIKFLLTTTFTNRTVNEDIITGDWRILNLEKAPFNFPKPIIIINENCNEGNGSYSDKSLGLWSVSQIDL
ncbi:MAG: class I SAM-dependent methyltransferase [Ignavibacteriaceae bacterium]|nr:class I SAM-dependent methyltransferase [Ignavibacteriaceae bacterium]